MEEYVIWNDRSEGTLYTLRNQKIQKTYVLEIHKALELALVSYMDIIARTPVGTKRSKEQQDQGIIFYLQQAYPRVQITLSLLNSIREVADMYLLRPSPSSMTTIMEYVKIGEEVHGTDYFVFSCGHFVKHIYTFKQCPVCKKEPTCIVKAEQAKWDGKDIFQMVQQLIQKVNILY